VSGIAAVRALLLAIGAHVDRGRWWCLTPILSGAAPARPLSRLK
jgi:hypothetical protein